MDVSVLWHIRLWHRISNLDFPHSNHVIMTLSYLYKYCFKSHVNNSVVTASLECVLITRIFIKFFLSQHFLGTVQKLFPSYFLHMWNNFPIDLGKTSINFGKLIKIQQSFILQLKDETNQIFNNIIKKYWKSTVCIVYLQYHENY